MGGTQGVLVFALIDRLSRPSNNFVWPLSVVTSQYMRQKMKKFNVSKFDLKKLQKEGRLGFIGVQYKKMSEEKNTTIN
jgi:hypothetical protein